MKQLTFTKGSLLAVLFLSSPFSFASSFNGVEYTSYPEEGILLGQGWDSFANKPANSVCIEFAPTLESGHDITVNVNEVHTRFQLDQMLKVSLSASYKSAWGSAGGSAKFSKSLKLDNKHSNILARIEVEKGSEFVSPVKLLNDKSVQYRPIRLTDSALRILSKRNTGLSEFRDVCGDSFVRIIKKGASLDVMIKFKRESKETTERISASLSAQGYGASAHTNVENSITQITDDENTQFFLHQTGGPIKPPKWRVEEFSNTVSQFLDVGPANLYPVNSISIGYTNYDSLVNWPKSIASDNLSSLNALLVLYFLYEDLHARYLSAIKNPDDYVFYNSEDLKNSKAVIGNYKGQTCWVPASGKAKILRGGKVIDLPADESHLCPNSVDGFGMETYSFARAIRSEQKLRDNLSYLRAAIYDCANGNTDLCDPSKAVPKASARFMKQAQEIASSDPKSSMLAALSTFSSSTALSISETDYGFLLELDENAEDESLKQDFVLLADQSLTNKADTGLKRDDVKDWSPTQIRDSIIAARAIRVKELIEDPSSLTLMKQTDHRLLLNEQIIEYHLLLMRSPIESTLESIDSANTLQVNAANNLAAFTALDKLNKERRRYAILSSLDVNELLCARRSLGRASKELCLNVSDLREIADRSSLNFVNGLNTKSVRGNSSCRLEIRWTGPRLSCSRGSTRHWLISKILRGDYGL